MKKIFTFLAFVFLAITGSAQQISISIDTIWYTPSNPVVGDNIFLHLSGTSNRTVTQQGPAFISDTGRLHTVSICYMGQHNTGPSTFNFSYNVYTAQSPGQDTLEWKFFYNKYDTLFCDTVLNFGMFIIQIDPVAVLAQQSSSLSVSWNAFTSSLTYDKLYTRADFKLMDMSGRIIQRQQLYTTSAEIKFPEMQEGIYMVFISDDEGILYRQKIFIGE